MTNWYVAADGAYNLDAGRHYYKDLGIQVELTTGTVEIRRLGSGGTWAATGTDSVISASDFYTIHRGNGPALQIVAIGDAKFTVRGA